MEYESNVGPLSRQLSMLRPERGYLDTPAADDTRPPVNVRLAQLRGQGPGFREQTVKELLDELENRPEILAVSQAMRPAAPAPPETPDEMERRIEAPLRANPALVPSARGLFARNQNFSGLADIQGARTGSAYDADASALADARMRRAANPVQLSVPEARQPEEPWERPQFTRRIIGNRDVTGINPPSEPVSGTLLQSHRTTTPVAEEVPADMQPPAPRPPGLSDAMKQEFSASGRDLSQMSPGGRARVLESEGREQMANANIYDRAQGRAAMRDIRQVGAAPWYQSPGMRAQTDLHNRALGLQEEAIRSGLGQDDRRLQMQLELADRARNDSREDRMFAMSQQHAERARGYRDQANAIRMSPDYRMNPKLRIQAEQLDREAQANDYYARQFASRAGGIGIPPFPGANANPATAGAGGEVAPGVPGATGAAGPSKAVPDDLTLQNAYERAVTMAPDDPAAQIAAYFQILQADGISSTAEAKRVAENRWPGLLDQYLANEANKEKYDIGNRYTSPIQHVGPDGRPIGGWWHNNVLAPLRAILPTTPGGGPGAMTQIPPRNL